MLNSNLERDYGWAIEAFRNAFGRAFVEVVHGNRGRSLSVKVGQWEYPLFKASTSNGEMFSLNDTRDRLSILQGYIDDAQSRFS